MTDSPGSTPELRSFGRRRGRKLSQSQDILLAETLPRVALDLASPAPADLAALFPVPVTATWLEIGFGGGEHLTWQARTHPNVGCIGAEPFRDGVVKLLGEIETAPLPNVRIHADDARELLRWLPAGSISRAFILFPDPWPKRRQRKRRLVSPATLQLLARCMTRGAELRVATDIGDYASAILRAVRNDPSFRWHASGPDDWRRRPDDWPPTRYELKAHETGRRCYHFNFVRI